MGCQCSSFSTIPGFPTLSESEAKSQVDKLEQAREGSANEDHLQITNQKCARDVKRTIETSDMALLFHSPSSFRHSPSSFAIFDALIDCEFALTKVHTAI